MNMPLLIVGLDVHLLQSKSVERDDAAVARAADALQVRSARTVTHLVQQIEDDGLERGERNLR
jgi:hypothetical protein